VLVEASWSLGDRLLYLRSPNLRGDDVAEMQERLSRLGFDCGRIDGIFGPLAARAVSEFQQNCGLETTGICGPDVVDALTLLGSQSGTGPGVAVVREMVTLRDLSAGEKRLVVGQSGRLSPLAHELVRRLRVEHPSTIGVEGPPSVQADAANRYGADAYLGIESSEGTRCTVAYYSTDRFTSAGGLSLARHVQAALVARLPDLQTELDGMRLPILRETRMPAVLCSLGPDDTVELCASVIVSTLARALDEWISGAPSE
jgi:N-acetylmuramoyl-L-alanine amidase